MKRGISAVKSQPALTELAEMFVPSCAIINAVAMNQICVSLVNTNFGTSHD